MTKQPPERRADGSIHVTLNNLPGFHFILQSGEDSTELLASLDQFLGLYLPALCEQRVSATVRRICPNALHVGTYHASCDYPDCRDDSQCQFWKKVDGVGETP